MGVRFSKAAAQRTAAAVRIVERRNLSGGTTWYRRRFPRGDDGASDVQTVQALLVKDLTAATVDGVVGTLTPSTVVEDAVLRLDNPEFGDEPATGETNGEDPPDLKFYDAVNRAWLGPLKAGDGGSTTEGEGEEETTTYHGQPMLVYGYVAQREVTTGEGEGATTELRDVFVITDVQNPPKIFRAVTEDDVAGGDWTNEIGSLVQLWGFRHYHASDDGTVSVNNPGSWDGTGYNLFIVDMAGGLQGLDLGCPE